ncbi:response regulator [Desulfolutivibrio sulfoxidireducens]|uniref:response regulator n=1 Tax=Desulfolutivibrio sulfoxidireducens TaxID=2773299 RepID=UPI00159E0948|nr:response regulator [Desulfolutivibrio sulfoxidireducens]QLA16985.1 response regulator [Desulfolutivibrio sulfoxidireducens]QLA20551.1 response regulator [Desulfolutivibrio sulfoxidireducens]
MPHATKVLVVEDSRVQARIMSDHIRAVTPYETLITATLAETAQVMEQSRDDIFVAVLDLNLPDDPGGEIVALANRHAVPAVVMTSSFDDEVRKRLLEQNVVDYFLKSMAEVANMENLIERLHKNLAVTVLVADDSRLSRHQMATLLKNQNYQVLEAEDGAVALDILTATPEVRLLITDYHMPRLDGFALITEIRKIRPKDKLAVIGVSAESGEQTARFLKNGANDFLTKPIGMEEFYCRVNQQMDMLDILEDYKALREKMAS